MNGLRAAPRDLFYGLSGQGFVWPSLGSAATITQNAYVNKDALHLISVQNKRVGNSGRFLFQLHVFDRSG